MPTDFILGSISKFESRLQRWSEHRFWPVLVVAIAILIALCSRLPHYESLPSVKASHHTRALEWWLEHPATTPPVEQFYPKVKESDADAGFASHFDKLTFRIVIPLLAQIFPFGLWTLIGVSHLAAIGCFILIYKLVLAYHRDPVTATLATWTFASCFAGQWGFSDFNCGDSLAFFLLLLALSESGLWLALFALFCASFVDERAVLAIPLVICHHFFARHSTIPNTILDEAKRKRHLLAICGAAAAIPLYAAARVLLIYVSGLHMGNTMLATKGTLVHNLEHAYPGPFFIVFKGLWVIEIMFFLHVWRTYRHGRIFVAGLGSAFGVVLAAAFLVWDFERSVAYVLPGIISALLCLPMETRRFRLALSATLIISLLWTSPVDSILRLAVYLKSSAV